jgi:hypothetical protein
MPKGNRSGTSPRAVWEALEPRVLLSAASPLQVGTTVKGEITDAYVDNLYAFSAQANHVYTFQTILGSLSDTELALFDRDGVAELGYNDNVDDSDDYSSKITWAAPADGTFFISVGGYGNETGSYQLVANDVRTIAHAQNSGSLTLNDTLVGNLSDAGAHNTYSFQAQAGHRYAFQTGLRLLKDSYLTLLDHDGVTQLAYNDDINENDLSSRIVWRAPADGTYFISLGSFDYFGGDYKLAWTDLTTQSHATPLTIGQPLSGHADVASEANLYSFHASAGTRYNFRMAIDSNGGVMQLLDSQGNALLTSIAMSSDDPSLIWQAPADGTYMLSLASTDGSEDYFLYSAADSNPAKTITTASPVRGRISGPTDLKLYQFTATAGEQYSFLATCPEQSVAKLQVLDGGGATDIKPDWTEGDYAFGRLIWTAPHSGYYYVELMSSDYGSDSAFNYTMMVSAVPDPSTAVAVSAGQTIRGRIANANGFKLFSIEASAGQTFSMRTLGGDLTDELFLVSDQNRTSQVASDYYWVTWTAPESGTYLIEVAATDDSTGSFQFSLLDQASLLTQSTPITIDTPQAGNLADANQVDYYQFQAVAGARYAVAATMLNNQGGAYISLLDQDGVTELEGNWTDDTGYTIYWTAPADGTYFLSIYADDGDSLGGYSLSLSNSTAADPLILSDQYISPGGTALWDEDTSDGSSAGGGQNGILLVGDPVAIDPAPPEAADPGYHPSSDSMQSDSLWNDIFAAKVHCSNTDRPAVDMQKSWLQQAAAIDAGDSYCRDGEPIPLVRTYDYIVVAFDNPDRGDSTVAQLTSPNGPLFGYSSWSLNRDGIQVFHVDSSISVVAIDLQAIDAVPNVVWSEPSFSVTANPDGHVYPEGNIEVMLKDGTDPANVFGEEYSYQHQGTGNLYRATLKAGGLNEYLEVFRLNARNDVAWATGNDAHQMNFEIIAPGINGPLINIDASISIVPAIYPPTVKIDPPASPSDLPTAQSRLLATYAKPKPTTTQKSASQPVSTDELLVATPFSSVRIQSNDDDKSLKDALFGSDDILGQDAASVF